MFPCQRFDWGKWPTSSGVHQSIGSLSTLIMSFLSGWGNSQIQIKWLRGVFLLFPVQFFLLCTKLSFRYFSPTCTVCNLLGSCVKSISCFRKHSQSWFLEEFETNYLHACLLTSSLLLAFVGTLQHFLASFYRQLSIGRLVWNYCPVCLSRDLRVLIWY